jgi:HSP20 family protein
MKHFSFRRCVMKWGLTKRDDDLWGIESFRKGLRGLFDDFFEMGPTSLMEAKWMPMVNVDEDDKTIHVRAEMPGLDEKDLNVTLENNMLTISGEKREERKEEKKRYVVSEMRFGSFSRSIALPEGIKGDSISATFKKGVLVIDMPKTEQVKTGKIKITVN